MIYLFNSTVFYYTWLKRALTPNCYLYTIVVRNKITNKGVPVCFLITNREVTPILAKWLNWIKKNTNVNPQRIVIDCSTTEIEALRQAFSGQVDILLCHWHIKRA
jgi:hypothetical protein